MSSNEKIKCLFSWCVSQTKGYKNITITNFTSSWRSGLGFCALLHHYGPEFIDYDSLDSEDVYKNCQLAFDVGENNFGIPALLDAKDMVVMKTPDRLSIITYLFQYYSTLATMKPRILSNINSPLSPLENISDFAVHEMNNSMDSESANQRIVVQSCELCNQVINFLEKLLVNDKHYHRSCYREIQLSNLKKRNLRSISQLNDNDDDQNMSTEHGTKQARLDPPSSEVQIDNNNNNGVVAIVKDKMVVIPDEAKKENARTNINVLLSRVQSAALPAMKPITFDVGRKIGDRFSENKAIDDNMETNVSISDTLKSDTKVETEPTKQVMEINQPKNDLTSSDPKVVLPLVKNEPIKLIKETDQSKIDITGSDSKVILSLVKNEPIKQIMETDQPKIDDRGSDTKIAVPLAKDILLTSNMETNQSKLNITRSDSEFPLQVVKNESINKIKETNKSKIDIINPGTKVPSQLTNHASINQIKVTNQSQIDITSSDTNVQSGLVNNEPIKPNMETNQSKIDCTIPNKDVPLSLVKNEPIKPNIETNLSKIEISRSNINVPLPTTEKSSILKNDKPKVNSNENLDFDAKLSMFGVKKSVSNVERKTGEANSNFKSRLSTVKEINSPIKEVDKSGVESKTHSANDRTASSKNELNTKKNMESEKHLTADTESHLNSSRVKYGGSSGTDVRSDIEVPPKDIVLTLPEDDISKLRKDKNIVAAKNIVADKNIVAAKNIVADKDNVSNKGTAVDKDPLNVMETSQLEICTIKLRHNVLPERPPKPTKEKLISQKSISNNDKKTCEQNPAKGSTITTQTFSPEIEKPIPKQRTKLPMEKSKSQDELNERISTSFSKEKKQPPSRPPPARPAPSRPVLEKRVVRANQFIPFDTLYQELKELNRLQSDLEKKGQPILNILKRMNDKDERYDGLLEEWLDIIGKKTAFFRKENDLHKVLKQQELEDRQTDLQYEFHLLSAKQESLKTPAEKAREEELLEQILSIVKARNELFEEEEEEEEEGEEDRNSTDKSDKLKPLKTLTILKNIFTKKSRSNSLTESMLQWKKMKKEDKVKKKSVFYDKK